jgi:hypothetical protein
MGSSLHCYFHWPGGKRLAESRAWCLISVQCCYSRKILFSFSFLHRPKKRSNRPEAETSFIFQILFPVRKIHSLSYFPTRLPHPSYSLYIYPPYARRNEEKGDGNRRHISTKVERKSSQIPVSFSSYASLYTTCPPLPVSHVFVYCSNCIYFAPSHARDSPPSDSWSFTVWTRRVNNQAESMMSKVKIRRWNFIRIPNFTSEFTFLLGSSTLFIKLNIVNSNWIKVGV